VIDADFRCEFEVDKRRDAIDNPKALCHTATQMTQSRNEPAGIAA